jgi:hypothetical protein
MKNLSFLNQDRLEIVRDTRGEKLLHKEIETKIDTSTRAYRYAIYYVPEEDSSVFETGNRWLGRDVRTNAILKPDLPEDINYDEWTKFTASPRRYGFHATLKPPFKLALEKTPQELRARLKEFTSHQKSFFISGFSVGRISSFLALLINPIGKDFPELAGKCVADFDDFRLPPTIGEIEARRHDGLTLQEQRNLEHWGYPYVLDTWKFHMTLTSSLQPVTGYTFQQHVTARFANHCNKRLSIESICLFEEIEAGFPFRLTERFPLGKP